MTNALAAEIHRAMAENGGAIDPAAASLGLKPYKLLRLINDNTELKLRWAPRKASETPEPGSAVDIHRRTIDTGAVSPLEAAESKAICREDALVQKGIEKMGLRGDVAEMAVALQAFQRNHYQSACEMMGGGITKQFLETMVAIDRISKQIEAGGMDPAYEAMLREDRRGLLDVMNKFYDRGNQAILTQAKVQALKKQAEGGGPRSGKPGFTPLIAIQGTNVTVTDKSGEPEKAQR